MVLSYESLKNSTVLGCVKDLERFLALKNAIFFVFSSQNRNFPLSLRQMSRR